LPGFDAVIFDCDGVLVDSEILAVEVELALLAEAGLDYDGSDFKARFLGMHDVAFMEALDADSRSRLGRPLRPDFMEVVHRDRSAAVRARLKPVAGAFEAVTAFRGARAVASSSRAHFLRHKLELAGLWELFDPHAYSADLVAHGKPVPDIFLHAAEAIGIAPERCLVIEDSPNGVRAGVAAGMTVWGFTGGAHCDPGHDHGLVAAGAVRCFANWLSVAKAYG